MAKSRVAVARPGLGVLLLSGLLWIIGGPTFLICASIVLIGTYFMKPPKMFRLMGVCAGIIPKAVGIRFKYEGLEQIPPTGGAVWVGNHVNNFDPMAVLAIAPRYIVALEKAAHFKWFIYGPMVRRYGNLPVGSGKSDTTTESMRKAEELLRAGTPVMVFPEGTRSRTGTLGRFRKGAFVLAIRAGVPILPFALKGAYELYGTGPYLRPGTITFKFLPPVETTGYNEHNADELVRKVRGMIEAEVFGTPSSRQPQEEKSEDASESSENRSSSGQDS